MLAISGHEQLKKAIAVIQTLEKKFSTWYHTYYT